MKAADIDKILTVIRRSIPGHCNCWKCTEALEAVVIVESQHRTPKKKKKNAT